MRWLFWFYWALYTLFVSLTVVFPILAGVSSGFEIFKASGSILPSVLMYLCLRGKEVQMLLFGLGFTAIAPVILQAHYFSSIPYVTVSIYVLFIPAAVFMLGRMLGFFRQKHNQLL